MMLFAFSYLKDIKKIVNSRMLERSIYNFIGLRRREPKNAGMGRIYDESDQAYRKNNRTYTLNCPDLSISQYVSFI